MKLSDLSPNPRNPRKITDKKLEMLKKALAEFGDLSGIVYNQRTQRLVGGHQRSKVLPPDAEITITHTYAAPTKVGSVADGYVTTDGERMAYRLVDWDETKEKAANIAANKHGGEFDLPALNDWLLELDAANFDMDLTGFDADELENLMAPVEQMEGQCDEDEVPELKEEPKTKLGDIYQLGRHRLMCGDSTSIDDVEKLMAGAKADMVYTDPPYGVSERTNRESAGRGALASNQDFAPVIGDDSTDTAIDAYNLCVGMGFPLLIFWGANYFAKSLPEVSSWVIWDKRDGVKSDDNADCELAWTNRGGPARVFHHLWKGCIRASEKAESKVHPTQKPTALAEWAITEFPKLKAQSVLDLFGGSGSTLIACEKTNRQCFMMELDPHYVEVIVARWEKFTGKKAELVQNG